MIPLYTPARQELSAGAAPQRFLNKASLSAAATLVATPSAPMQIPNDKVALLRHVQLAGESGAAQTCDRITVDWYADNGVTFLARLAHFFLSAGILRHCQNIYPYDVVMMPGETLIANGFFSAAGVANQMSIAASGIYLPKGNVQFR